MYPIPFTQPFTAPDGTTRRPLAERVPECVPRDEKGHPLILAGHTAT